jgi:peptidyl-prolyl cis-trans isomerase A (cyclophilin A)
MSATRRMLIALAAWTLAAPAFAQTAGQSTGQSAVPPPAAPEPAVTDPPPAPLPRVALDTAQGRIVLEIEAVKAPITAANFLRYVDTKRYDGATIYRASKPPGATANDYGLIQGGLQADPKKVFAPIAHESTLKTGLKNVDGTIAMGRFAPGTAKADWFIMAGDQPYLDADPADPNNPGFAAFGRVLEGMEVVHAILGLPVDPNRGEGAMKGEMLVDPVVIRTARRVTP